MIIAPEVLLNAYTQGFFPMADSKEGEIHWYTANPRAIIPLDSVKAPRSLKQFIKKFRPEFRIDTSFVQVIDACSEREDTWISGEIINSYIILHRLGFAHSVETWLDGEMAGGLYGVAVGGAFFGESMFSRVSNASKAAFYHLVEHLKGRRFILLDSQFLNPHTESLGAIEIPKREYLRILKKAINLEVKFS